MWLWNKNKIDNEIKLTEEIVEIKNKISELNSLIYRLTELRSKSFKIKFCYSNEYENIEIRNDIFCKALKEEIEYKRNILKEKMYHLKEVFGDIEDESME